MRPRLAHKVATRVLSLQVDSKGCSGERVISEMGRRLEVALQEAREPYAWVLILGGKCHTKPFPAGILLAVPIAISNKPNLLCVYLASPLNLRLYMDLNPQLGSYLRCVVELALSPGLPRPKSQNKIDQAYRDLESKAACDLGGGLGTRLW